MSDFICTPTTPWSEAIGRVGRVIHPGGREVGEQEDGWPAGDIVTYKCSVCGATWRAELPQ